MSTATITSTVTETPTAIVEGATVSTGFAIRSTPWEKHCAYVYKEGVTIGRVTAKAFQLKSGKISVWIPKSAIAKSLSLGNHLGFEAWFECRVDKWQHLLFTLNSEMVGTV